MEFNEIAGEITANAAALQQEIVEIAKFLEGREHLFRHAQFGYMMACMGQIDVMSYCMYGPDRGPGRPKGYQTIRMQRFMERFVDRNKVEEHRIAIQLMRHTLMHTGALRYPYDETSEVAYTWQTYFTDSSSPDRAHYELTEENRAYQDHLLEAAGSLPVDKIKALNLRLILFAAQVVQAAEGWHDAMRTDSKMQELCVSNYAAVRFQVFNRKTRPKT